MRNVSNAVKSLPDSLAEGVSKVSADMGRMSEKLGQDIKQSIFKVEHVWRISAQRQMRKRPETSPTGRFACWLFVLPVYM